MAPKTVLVIDSEHEVRVQIRRSLEEAGHFVISAASGAEALLLLEKTSTPAIIYVSSASLMISGEHILTLLHGQEKYSKVPAVQIKHTEEADLPGICDSILAPFSTEAVVAALKHCF